MKKIKLFALAAFAMLSTNAFAQDYADGYLRYSVAGSNATITGFVANQERAAVEIPATVQDPVTPATKYNVIAVAADAFKNKTIIESVTIADGNVATIYGGAFAGCTKLTTVTIGKAVKDIKNEDALAAAKGGAFKGCTSLTTVNFTARAAAPTDPVLDIAAGTFEETAIATLDLTGTNMTTLNKLFEDLNTTLSSVKLPATLTTISDGAFASLAGLADTGIDWSACTTNDLTIGGGTAGVFTGSPLIKDLVLPAKVKVISVNALAGSNIQKLTINSYDGAGFPTIAATGETKLKTLIVKGNFQGVIASGAFSSLTSATFEGTVATGALTAGSFKNCANLATVTFKGELKYNATGPAYAIAAAAFSDGTNFAGKALFTATPTAPALTIVYEPAATVATCGINAAAFSADGSEGVYAQLATTTAYAAKLTAAPLGWVAAGGAPNYSIKISADAAPEKETPLKVATKEGSKYYYAKLFHSTNNYKISKKQGDATIIVYTAYVDDSDATIYMENGRIIDGYYEIPFGTPVIVKSTSSADVKVNTGTGGGVTSFGVAGEIYTVGVGNTTGLTIKDAAAALDEVAYFLAPIADYGFLWSKFKDNRVLVGETAGEYDEEEGVTTTDFIINCPVIEAARLKVVWLDGSEDETTAIQAVKNVDVENNAIYNLAGQKVSAAYKGVVIKNGKKFIQK